MLRWLIGCVVVVNKYGDEWDWLLLEVLVLLELMGELFISYIVFWIGSEDSFLGWGIIVYMV